MRRIAFILSILGLFSLLTILLLEKPSQINSQQELSNLIDNQLVSTSGLVIKQSQSSKFIFLTLDNNSSLIYKGNYKNFLNKSISIIGTKDSFNYDKIKVLKLKTNDN